MCLILDASKLSEFLNNDESMIPIKKWIKKKGRIAYSPTDQFKKELEGALKKFGRELDRELKNLKSYRQSNKIRNYDKGEVEEIENELKALKGLEKLKSNDSHIIALAQVSKAKLLVSGDKNLHADFKNKKYIKGGNVYQDTSHRHLLIGLKCP